MSRHPSLVSWKSFSEVTLDELVKLNIPIYLAYGSDDINSDYCDLLPLHFIEQHKSNLTRKMYPNLEHNFFPIDETGRPDYSNGKWVIVMSAFIKWANNTANLH